MPAPARLYAGNHPDSFWRLLLEPRPGDDEWRAAALAASEVLPEPARAGAREIDTLLERTLGEAQFGPRHFRLTLPRRSYYALKGILPRAVTTRLRRAHRHLAAHAFGLGWPVEPRYAIFQRATLAGLLAARGLGSARFVHFWPRGRRFALVLTHDVESAEGQALVPVLAEMEERLGLRSSFNFVPERYPLDRGLMAELRGRGFEVAVHDLDHDGRLFSSRRRFVRRAERINRHVRELEAAGFRAALMHRHPEWLQALDVEYDLSFFDTDPYEPVPGGTMSIWPFQLGRFVELPYTLVQDYTLTNVLGERTARLWTEKVAFLADQHGMALVNSHPDYLRQAGTERVYREFLEAVRSLGGYWNALPRDVARWWRARASAETLASLPEGVTGWARLAPSEPGGVHLGIEEGAGQGHAPTAYRRA